MASPILSPQHQTMLCSQNGNMVTMVLDDQSNTTDGAVLDCPLCFVGQTTVPAQVFVYQLQQRFGHLQPISALARRANAIDLSPPSRGPPSFV